MNKSKQYLNAEEIKEIIRQREKSEMDYYAGISSALNRGIAQGIAQSRNEMVENMRKNGFTEEQIRLALGN